MEISVRLEELFDYLDRETLDFAFVSLMRQSSDEELQEMIEKLKLHTNMRYKPTSPIIVP